MKATLLLLLGCWACPAATLLDTFNQSQSGGCSYSFTPNYSSCDVIGDPALYDIQKADVQIANGWANVTLFLNYGGGITLQPFTDGLDLHIGDLFFYSPSDSSRYLFGVPVVNHDGFVADELYRLGGSTVGLTADDILHDTGYYYRRNQVVALGGGGTPLAMGSPVWVENYGNGTTDAQYAVHLEFPAPMDFLSAITYNDQIGLSFASAYCGNDVIQGTVDPPNATPEPEPLILLLLGAVAVAVSRIRWKPRKAKPSGGPAC